MTTVQDLTDKLISKIYDYLDRNDLTADDYRIICNSLTVLRNDQEKLLEKVQSYLETTLKNTMPIDMPCVPPLHESEVSDV